MPNLLGLYIDTNVIGWTLLEQETKKIKTMGTHVFPVGCENFGSGKRELSRRAMKRFKRTGRLRYARSFKRKSKVLEILIDNKMCPLSKDDLEMWKREKVFPESKLREWFKINPYSTRTKALQEKISLHQIGRILYQFTLHRGFPLVDRNSGFKESAMFSGIPAMNRPGIKEAQLHTRNQSLGSYLNSLMPAEEESYHHTKERVRNRFLSREMYLEEAHKILNFQSRFHKELSTELKAVLIGLNDKSSHDNGAVFFQRPLKSQKYRVGNCQFEKKKTKCSVSNLVYQDVMAYGWINSIKKNGNPLNDMERDTIFHFYQTNRRFNFQAVRNLLNGANDHFNKKDDEVIHGSFINATLSSPRLFGDSWFLFDEDVKEEIWHTLYFFNNEEKLRMYAQERWNLNYEQALRLSSINLDKRYSPISRKAAKNILFFLKRGVSYELATVLGGVKNSVSSWDTIAESDVNFIIKRVVNIYKENKVFGFIHNLQDFLINEMQLTDFQIKKLYGQSSKVAEIPLEKNFAIGKEADKEIYDFKNPLLIAALFQTRKILNGLIKTYGDINEIQAELSADLKVNKFQRYLYRLDQKRLSRLRSSYQAFLGSIAENITPMNLLKFELWQECKQTCPYTGEHLPLEKLFTDHVSIVYIHPWNRSLNDSVMNKTLCIKSFTPNILNLTPYEYFSEQVNDDWSFIVKRAARLFSNTKDFPSSYKKFKRFVKRYYQRDFLKHQLNDPNMLSKEVMCYLSKVCPKVSVGPGHATQHFVELWRLKNIFPKQAHHNPKTDYRFPALLAYINANRNYHYLEALSQRNKYLQQKSKGAFPIPYDGFRDDVEYHILSILVSHKKENKLISRRVRKSRNGQELRENLCVSVKGSLHKESVFGKRTPPNQITAYHIRKPLSSFRTLRQVEKIVDPIIRKIVIDALKVDGAVKGDTIFPGALTQKDHNGYIRSKIFLPNANGDPVPIKKVRIRETINGAVNLKEGVNQHVNLRNNHHVLIYQDQSGKYLEQVVSFWEAVRRKRFEEAVYQLPPDGEALVTTLEINDLFLLGMDQIKQPLDTESNSFLAKYLYRVQKLSSKFYEFRLVNDNLLSETEYPNYIRINNFGERKTGWLSYNPIKVKLSPIGQISLAEEKYYTINSKIKQI